MRKLFEVQGIPNGVINRTDLFSEEGSQVRDEIALEFRWVWGTYDCREDN